MHILERLVDGAAIIARQAAPTAAAATPDAAISTPATTSFPQPSSITDTAPSPTNTGSGGGGGGSSPLLFFVALGFGVVFTNLWIIVGVKYCFRYNARARQMRLAAEEGDPIGLEPVPTRPHRRRREKKLMTIDEVNEKFPMMKYKTWVASRAHEGLSTRGGIDAPSRSASVRSAQGVTVQHKERDSSEESDEKRKSFKVSSSVVAATTSAADVDDTMSPAAHASATLPASDPLAVSTASAVSDSPTPAAGADATYGPNEAARASDDHLHSGDEDDDHIDAAMSPEYAGTSGDTCAICIDTLENDDDVRGLTCGHAFHAVCIDPWLTSRRACCPLCKADYYTPKPRPDGADPNAPILIAVSLGGNGDARQNGLNMPSRTGTSWFGSSRLLGSRVGPTGAPAASTAPSARPSLLDRLRTQAESAVRQERDATAAAAAANRAAQQPAPTRRNWLGNLRNPLRRQGDSASPDQAAAAGNVTPSQLEAGVRSAAH